MKQDFLNYIQETFDFPADEMKDFEAALSKPLKKTLRVNTNKISIEDFKHLAEKNNWSLTQTSLWSNMFYIDREDTSLALWHMLEHIAWYIYMQELAASSSPFYMSEDMIDNSEYTILDMSASPGGKTTQLAEYYPNSLIIANEIDKSRMRQLHENTDRLGSRNVYVTNYDGRHFKNYPETFDKILLDAPCSWEWTAYKTDDALKYWNLKNIKRIAKLQYQLLESAFIALKVWWELVYSTCTLNRLENEDIINKLTDKYWDYFRIISLDSPHTIFPQGEKWSCSPPLPLGEEIQRWGQHIVRSWPHKNNTGWFFVVKLIKKSPVENIKIKNKLQKNTQWFEKLSNTSEKIVTSFLSENFWLSLPGKFYTYRNEIYYGGKNIDFFWENFFFYKMWVKIWKLEDGEFHPNFFLWTNFDIFEKNTFPVNQEIIHSLYSGWEVQMDTMWQDWYYQIYHENIPAWCVKIKWWIMKSLLESRFMRKA